MTEESIDKCFKFDFSWVLHKEKVVTIAKSILMQMMLIQILLLRVVSLKLFYFLGYFL